MRVALLFLVACGGGDGSDPDGSTADPQGERFELTVSGPAFPDTQHFQLDVERLFWNVGSDYSFVTTFTGGGDGIVSDDGAFVLDTFSGGIGPEVIDGVGTIELGEKADGTDGWVIIIWPTGCADNYVGCDRVSLATRDGTMNVTAHQLGEAPSRPHEEGPTFIGGSFEADAEEQDEPNEGRAFEVEGVFYLED